MLEPYTPFHPAPLTDPDSAEVLDHTLEELARRRTPYWLGDAGVTLHVLVSLHHEIAARLPDAVADARDHQYTWAEIGDLLGTTRAAAWNRYGRADRRGSPHPVTD